MNFGEPISASWAFESNWNDPIYGSPASLAELSAQATPISKDHVKDDSKQNTETPPNVLDSNIKSSNEVSIGEKPNLISHPQDSNLNTSLKDSLIETPKRVVRTHENIQTPRETRNERYPSPLPSNKSFSLNLTAGTPMNSKTPITPVTPKTPKNSYYLKSPSKFSTPRFISGKIASPYSNQTVEGFKQIIDPDVWKKATRKYQDEESENENENENENEENNEKDSKIELENKNNNLEYFDHHMEIESLSEEETNDLINKDFPNFDEKDDIHSDNQEELMQNDFYQEESMQNNFDQEITDQEESNQKEINSGRYFSVESTPTKIFRTSRLDKILNKKDEDDPIYNLIQTKRLYMENERQDENEAIKSYNDHEDFNHEESDYKDMNLETKTENEEVPRFEYKVVKNDQDASLFYNPVVQTNQFVDSDAPQSFQSQINNESFKNFQYEKIDNEPKINNHQSPYSQISENSEIKENEFTNEKSKVKPRFSIHKAGEVHISESPIVPQNANQSNLIKTDISNDQGTKSDDHSQKQMTFAYTIIENSEPENKEIQQNSIQKSDKIFVPEKSNSIKELPEFEPESRENELNNKSDSSQDNKIDSPQKEETSETESQENKLDKSNQPFEKRIFDKLLSDIDNELGIKVPKMKVKGTRNKIDLMSKYDEDKKKEEEKVTDSPRKKVKSIQILPDHQLSCTANKKAARYIVESGELSVIIDSKKRLIGKGGIIDIIKGKEIILMNNGTETAIITKTTKI